MKLRRPELVAILFAMSAPVSAGDALSGIRLQLPPVDEWLRGPARVEIRNEVSGVTAAFETLLFVKREATIEALALRILGTWSSPD